MKKMISFTLALVLCVCVLSVCVFAANPSASLTGPDQVRAGDTITLTFTLDGKGLFAVSGTLDYDKDVLELVEAASKKKTWEIELFGDVIVAEGKDFEDPVDGKTALFTLKFRVNKNVTTGSAVSVSVTDLLASDSVNDQKISTVKYSAKIAPPLSKENDLASLGASNAAINPSFSADVTKYTAEVPFSVDKLSVNAKAKDSNAKVSVNSPTLKPGAVTDVTVTVTAENGDKKVYTISVKRGQDPNYVPSGENTLSGITVEGFLLSPVFDPEVTNYVIWLPYEVESVNVSGSASNALATVKVLGGDALLPGQDNEIQIYCIAENGDQKVYTVTAKRAAAHGNEPTEPTQPTEPTAPVDPTEPSTAPTMPSEPQQTEPSTAPTQPSGSGSQQPQGALQLWMLIAAASLCLALGLAAGLLIGRKMKF